MIWSIFRSLVHILWYFVYDRFYDPLCINFMIWYMIWSILRSLVHKLWYDIWYDRFYDPSCIKFDDMIWSILRSLVHELWYDIWHNMIWYDDISVNCSWLPPGGSSSVHIYTQTVHRTTQKFKKSAGRAPSLRVIPWHLPYNWGKSIEKPLH
jgi:hypothetical protein